MDIRQLIQALTTGGTGQQAAPANTLTPNNAQGSSSQSDMKNYEDSKTDASRNTKHYSYFIIDIGCFRIQRCEFVER